MGPDNLAPGFGNQRCGILTKTVSKKAGKNLQGEGRNNFGSLKGTCIACAKGHLAKGRQHLLYSL